MFPVVDNLVGTELYHRNEIYSMFALLALFGMSVLPFIYLCCYIKTSVSTTITILSLAAIVLVSSKIYLPRTMPGRNFSDPGSEFSNGIKNSTEELRFSMKFGQFPGTFSVSS